MYFTPNYAPLPSCRFRRARVGLGGRWHAHTAGLNAATDGLHGVVVGAINVSLMAKCAVSAMLRYLNGLGLGGLVHCTDNKMPMSGQQKGHPRVCPLELRYRPLLWDGRMLFAVREKTGNGRSINPNRSVNGHKNNVKPLPPQAPPGREAVNPSRMNSNWLTQNVDADQYHLFSLKSFESIMFDSAFHC